MAEPGNGLTQRDIMLQTLSTVERIDGRLRGVELDVARLSDVRETVREHDQRISELEDLTSQRVGASAVSWRVATLALSALAVVILIPAFIIQLSGLPL